MAQEITPKDLAEALHQGKSVRLIDVRQAWENQRVHLPGSTLIPLNELPARASEIPSDPDALLVVYCHHGIRSQSAADYLASLGHANVLSLAGGIDAWSCGGDPPPPRY